MGLLEHPYPERSPNNNKRSISAPEFLRFRFSHANPPFSMNEFAYYREGALHERGPIQDYVKEMLRSDEQIALEAYNFMMSNMPFAEHFGTSSKTGVVMRSLAELRRRVNVAALREEAFAKAIAPDPTTMHPAETYWGKAGYSISEFGRLVVAYADTLKETSGKIEKDERRVWDAKENYGNSVFRPYAAASMSGVSGRVWVGQLTNESKFSRLGTLAGMSQSGLGGRLVVTDKKLLRELTQIVRDDPTLSDAYFAACVVQMQEKYTQSFLEKANATGARVRAFMEAETKKYNEPVERHGIFLLQEHFKHADSKPLLIAHREGRARNIPNLIITAGEKGWIYISGEIRLKGSRDPIGFKLGIRRGTYQGFEYWPNTYSLPKGKNAIEISNAIQAVGSNFVHSMKTMEVEQYTELVKRRGHIEAQKIIHSGQRQLCKATHLSDFFSKMDYEVTELRK